VFADGGHSYARLGFDTGCVEADEQIQEGTTTVDANPWLWSALDALIPINRPRWELGPEEREADQGPVLPSRRWQLSDSSLRALLELQAAAAECRLCVTPGPEDLRALVREAVRLRPHARTAALAFDLDPGRDVSVSLEPWGPTQRLRGTQWEGARGRPRVAVGRKLDVLLPLLAHARHVRIWLHPSGGTSWFQVEMPGVTFDLGLRGGPWWHHERSTLAAMAPPVAPEFLAPVLTHLVARRVLSVDDAVRETGLEPERAARVFARLCRGGRALYEPHRDRFRHRELFAVPIDMSSLDAIHPQIDTARALVRDGSMVCDAAERREIWCKPPAPRAGADRDARGRLVMLEVHGRAGEAVTTRIQMVPEGQMVSGSCTCMPAAAPERRRDPCEHMLALAMVAQAGE